MASPTVRAHHDELRTIRGTFSQEGEAIADMNQTLASCMETLQGGDWIGKGATAFYAEMNGEIMPALKRLRAALAEAARISQQISNTMREAEEEASGCFHIA